MISSPKVSIAMPVYNGGAYFELALRSAIAQTFEDIEVVIVNDGSSDDGATEAVALKYAATDKRIKYIYQENAGVAAALNTVMENATGEYFAWLSHDDLFMPHKIESQLSYIRKIPNKHASLFSNYALIDDKGAIICEVNQDIGKFISRPSLSLLRGGINGCTVLIPMDVLREHGLFDTQLRHTQDYDFWDRIIGKHDFFFQPEILVHYRIHPGQDSNKPDAIAEGDTLWIKLLENRNDLEKAQLFGSCKNYYAQMASFLKQTPYEKALNFAKQSDVSAARSEDILVSVILPFLNEIDLVVEAAVSALSQTHRRLELLLIDDGSTDSMQPLTDLARNDKRVRLFHQPNQGVAAARNAGLQMARGEYIAFLDADDIFLPEKIAIQLSAMLEKGAIFSHTSYFVTYPEQFERRGLIRTGAFSGQMYPNIISDCPIATPTVMFHSVLIAEGYRFPFGLNLCEDIILWTTIAQRHEILGLDEPLSVVRWDQNTSAINNTKMKRGYETLIDHFINDKIHSRYVYQISHLKILLQTLELSFDTYPNVKELAYIFS